MLAMKHNCWPVFLSLIGMKLLVFSALLSFQKAQQGKVFDTLTSCLEHSVFIKVLWQNLHW